MTEELENQLQQKYNLIKKETDELNRILYYNASNYSSKEKNNFEKLNKLLFKLPKMRKLNSKKFIYNNIIATEIK